MSVPHSYGSVPAGDFDSTVEHADVDEDLAILAVARRKTVGDAGKNRLRSKPAKRGLLQGRLKENWTRPGILARGSARTNSHKTNPSTLWKARSESGRQTAAGQLKKEGRGREVYPPRGRFVVRDGDLFSARTGKAVPHASRQAVQGDGKWASPPTTSQNRPAPDKRTPGQAPSPADVAETVKHCQQLVPVTNVAGGLRATACAFKPQKTSCGAAGAVKTDDPTVRWPRNVHKEILAE